MTIMAFFYFGLCDSSALDFELDELSSEDVLFELEHSSLFSSDSYKPFDFKSWFYRFL